MFVITPGLTVILAVAKYFLLPLHDLHEYLAPGHYSSQWEEDSKAPPPGVNLYQNPVVATNSPDPAVLELPHNEGYILVATSNHATVHNQGPAFPIMFSRDLVHWNPSGHVFPPGSWPSWAKSEMWAPEIHLVNNRFVVYFTAGDEDGRLHIGVAVSQTDSYTGPYSDQGDPLVTEPGSLVGAIDAHYFNDHKSGGHFLLWKTDSVFGFESSLIYIREMNEDGVSFKEGSEATVMLRADQPAERLTAEGPWLMYRDGEYFLFYSSGWFFEAKYHMRVARSRHLEGPYTKNTRPVLQTDWATYNEGGNTSFVGPGHGCVVKDHAGDWWIVYHSWVHGREDQEPGRLALMDKVVWRDGWPTVRSPTSTPTPAPATSARPHPAVLCQQADQEEGVCQSKNK